MESASAIVRAATPEERELARYLAEVEDRRRVAADLEAELASLRSRLAQFEAEYHARVGSLFVELDRVRLAVDEYDRRCAALRDRPDADPAEVERDVRAAFAGRREEIGRDEEEVHGYAREHAAERQRPALDRPGEEDLLRLYRDLARRFHPDLARTEEERRRREPVMRRVNDAFRDRDLAALRTVAQEAEPIDPRFERRPIGERLVWAIREVARLDGLAAALREGLTALRATDAFALWSRQEGGEPVVDRLAVDLAREIEAEKVRLARQIAAYRRLLEGRVR